jgi:hypothetical protein
MGKILDGLLFAGPALALLLGFLFAFAPPKSRLFARRPRHIAVAVGVPMLMAAAGAWRMHSVESDSAVVLAVVGIGLAGCAIGFAGAFGFGVLVRFASQWFSGRGSRHHFGDTGVSTLVMRRSRRTTLPPGPRIKQGK